MRRSVIIDTNILVSSIISPKGVCRKVITDILKDTKTDLFISNEILNEYHEILNRKKFSKIAGFSSEAVILLIAISEFGILLEPKVRIDILKDKADNKFLELAVESKADYLITGNVNDFNFKSYKTTEIISPKKFLDI